MSDRIQRNAHLRYYLFPGGGVEPDETVREAAIREAAEELGLRVAIDRPVAVVTFGGKEQVYLLAHSIAGTFGTGTGEEMTGRDVSGHGSYAPVWMPAGRLCDADVRPRAVAELVAGCVHGGWPSEPLRLTELARVRKALCYVIRDGRLLVFRHRDHPEAGVQVPAGTLHDDESPAAGAIRECEEETGRFGFRIARRLGGCDYEFRDTAPGFKRHEIHERHFFALQPPAGLPDRWSHLAEEGNGDFWFEFSWVPPRPDLVLAGEQHAYVAQLAVDALGNPAP